jgi:hypothetical protein
MTFKPIRIEIINNDGSSWFFAKFGNYKEAIKKLKELQND